MIAVLRGDMTFAAFHANTIANLKDDDAHRRAKDFERLCMWLMSSVSGPGVPLIYEALPFSEQDQAVGPIWDAWQTYHAKATLRIYWDLYHFFHVDPPRTKGLRRVWEATRSMVESQPANKPSCRCHQCLPDQEQWSLLPSLSCEQCSQGFFRLWKL
jgi:hypothetical protein